MNKNLKLGIVIPCYNESEIIESSLLKLKTFLSAKLSDRLEKITFCIVDDGSTDDTWQKLVNIKNNETMNYDYSLIKFDSNYGHQNALYAGMSEINNKVDCIISIDADLEHDINVIPDFIKEFNKGNEIVLGIRKNRNGDRLFKRITSKLFYFLATLSGSNIESNHADYRLLSKKAIDKILDNKDKNILLRGQVSNLNLKKSHVLFQVFVDKNRKSRYSIIKMINLAFDSITLTGKLPLRLLSLIGLVVIIFSLLMIIYILFMKLTFQNVIPGWASTVLPIYLIGGLNILAISIIAEYMGRIYEILTDKKKYIIEEIID